MTLSESERPVVLFDGICNLCNGAVRFIIARDPAAHFRLAALQSEAARRLWGEDPPVESIVLVEAGVTYTKSTAVLRIVRGLRFPWPLLSAFMVVPRRLRDAIYDWIARHRYRWFGKREVCMLPTPEIRGRFLE
jgi:predicted DCC family thiol-disulfide oxidoreductase YuxK